MRRKEPTQRKISASKRMNLNRNPTLIATVRMLGFAIRHHRFYLCVWGGGLDVKRSSQIFHLRQAFSSCGGIENR